MAWLIRGSTRHKWHNPLIAPNLYCKSREDIIAAQRPLFAEAHIYKETYGCLPFGLYAHGRAIEDRFWPISGYFINDFEKLPRLIGLAGFYLGRVDKRDSQTRLVLIQDCFLRSSHGSRGFVRCGMGTDRAAAAA